MSFHELPEIRSVGISIYDPIWGQKDHRSHNIELLHIVNGEINLKIGKKRFQAIQGDTVFVPSMTVHRDEFDFSTTLHILMISFQWSSEKNFFKEVSNDDLKIFSQAQKDELQLIFDAFRKDSVTDPEFPEDQLLASSRLHTVLLLMLKNSRLNRQHDREEQEDVGRKKRQHLMLEAKKYLEEHYYEPISLESIASDLSISPFYLSRIFSEESDFSLFTYLTSLRMAKARSLLAEGRMNIAEVADAVGFDNSNYFSKVFKKYHGKTPSNYLLSAEN